MMLPSYEEYARQAEIDRQYKEFDDSPIYIGAEQWKRITNFVYHISKRIQDNSYTETEYMLSKKLVPFIVELMYDHREAKIAEEELKARITFDYLPGETENQHDARVENMIDEGLLKR